MKPLFSILLFSLLTTFVSSQDAKDIDSYVTTKDFKFEELTIEQSVKKVLDQVGFPYSIIILTDKEEVRKSFKETKITLRLNAGVPYDELLRHIVRAGGFSIHRKGSSWIVREYLVDHEDAHELWSQSHRITKPEAKALGLLNELGEFNKKAMDAWLFEKSDEQAGYSVTRGLFIIRAYKNKRDSISSLLHLYREGYKIPTLFSINKAKKTQ